ncbi:MAG: hypothetical protein H6645_10820 [Caldilineaceae bacterium]|nr:hypothetical protein [Caldilineaceae bacterium]
MNQNEQAIVAAQQAVANNAEDDKRYVELGMAYFTGQMEEARAAFRKR